MIDLIYGEDEAIANWVAERIPHVGKQGFGPSKAIGISLDGYLIAGVVYHRFHHYDIEMSIAAIDPKWATRKTLEILFQYPFKQLGCARITATTPKHYKEVRRFLERLNFKLEGTLRKGLGAEDLCIYGLLRDEVKYKSKHQFKPKSNLTQE